MRRVLIAGGDSAIGKALADYITGQGHQVSRSTRRVNEVSCLRPFLDLTNCDSINVLNADVYDTAVICGAATSVSYCEIYPDYSRLVNVDGTLKLLNLLAKKGVHIIFLSTNMVFDGRRPDFSALDRKSALTVYGKQKAEVEDWIACESPSSSIIRFGKILTPEFKLFKEWKESLLASRSIRPHRDKAMAPISVEMAVKIIYWLMKWRKAGIYQATASVEVTYTEAARYLATICEADQRLIRPVSSQRNYLKSNRENNSGRWSTLRISDEITQQFGYFSPLEAIRLAVN